MARARQSRCTPCMCVNHPRCHSCPGEQTQVRGSCCRQACAHGRAYGTHVARGADGGAVPCNKVSQAHRIEEVPAPASRGQWVWRRGRERACVHRSGCANYIAVRVVVLAEVAKAPGCKWAAEDTYLAYTHSAGAKHGSHDVPSAEPAPARSWPRKVHLQVRVQVDLAGQPVDTHTSQSDRSKKE